MKDLSNLYPAICEGSEDVQRPDNWESTSINTGVVGSVKYSWMSPATADSTIFGWMRDEESYKTAQRAYMLEKLELNLSSEELEGKTVFAVRADKPYDTIVMMFPSTYPLAAYSNNEFLEEVAAKEVELECKLYVIDDAGLVVYQDYALVTPFKSMTIDEWEEYADQCATVSIHFLGASIHYNREATYGGYHTHYLTYEGRYFYSQDNRFTPAIDKIRRFFIEQEVVDAAQKCDLYKAMKRASFHKTKTLDSVPSHLIVYDNEGETLDRYTIVFFGPHIPEGYHIGCSHDGGRFYQHGDKALMSDKVISWETFKKENPIYAKEIRAEYLDWWN